MKLASLAWSGLRWCASAAGTFALWTLWLGLALLLAAQAYVASTNQLELPVAVRRDLEARLAASGVRATFGRTRFDPSGRVLIEDVALSLPGMGEPIVTARAVYARVNPWALLARRFDPVEIAITGAELRIPAMFVPYARSEEGVRDLDAVLVPRGGSVEVRSLTFRLGGLAATARGSLYLGKLPASRAGGLPLASFLARHYRALSREFARAMEVLDRFDAPTLSAEFARSPSDGAVVKAELFARGLTVAGDRAAAARTVRIAGSFPLLPSGPYDFRVAAEAASLSLARPAVAARRVRIRVAGRVGPGGPRLSLRRIEAAADEADAAGLTVAEPMAEGDLAGMPGRVRVEGRALAFQSPVAVGADADLGAGTASVRFDAAVAPAAIDAAGARLRRNLRPFLALEEPVRAAGTARFGPKWKFQDARAEISGRRVRAHGVVIDRVGGEVEFDGRRLVAPEAFVRVGGDEARGSYEGDLRTRRYRFLLRGRLRPLDISPWFTAWWPRFFDNFGFPAERPAADIDLRGRWGTDHETSVFLSVDSEGPVARGAPFDRIRGRLFLRPQYEDALEFHARAGTGVAEGTFRRRADPASGALRRLDLDVTSTLDYALAARVFGPAGARMLEPFSFDRPPRVALRGKVEGAEEHLRISVKSNGGFRFHDFPFDRVAFSAAVDDDVLSLDGVEAGFAAGTLTGRARLAGRGKARRLSFSGSLRGANLSRAVGIVQAFSARGRGVAAPAPSAFLKERTDAVLDLSASAEGPYDPLALKGPGFATVHGSDLLQVKLLGLLSQLLNFTSLRFNTARAQFALEGSRVSFPSVQVTGANSAISAHGTYDLDRHALDFSARVFPFRESKFLLPQIMNLATAPLSQVLGVRLTGSLDRPRWAFTAGPTNLLRGLLSPGAESPSPTPSK